MRLCKACILGGLALASCVGPLAAAEGDAPPTPAQATPAAPPASTPAPELKYAPTAPPPPAPPEEIWGTLLSNQDAYNRRSGFGVTDDPGLLNQWGIRPFITAGTWMLEPLFKSNPAFIVTQQPAGARAPTGSEVVDFSYPPVFTPRLIVGVETDSGCGFMTSWWYYNLDAPTFTIFNSGGAAQVTSFGSVPLQGVAPVTSPSSTGNKLGIFNDAMSVNSFLHLDVWDYEVFQDWNWGGWSLRGSGGIRYAYLSQDYVVQRTNSGKVAAGGTTTTLNADFTDLASGHNFSGVGTTFALDALRPLGNSGFAFYGNWRTAFLFGPDHIHTARLSRQVQTVTTGGKSTTTTTTAISSFDDQLTIVMPVQEVEVGIEYVRLVRTHQIFAKAGFVTTSWFDAGSATSDHGYLGFIGLSLLAGWMF
jgi:hypothetical protein